MLARHRISITLAFAGLATTLPCVAAEAATSSTTSAADAKLSTAVIHAIDEDGEIVLKGDIAGRVVTVPHGGSVHVVLHDSERYEVHALTLSADGSDPEPWVRNRRAGTSEAVFTDLDFEIAVQIEPVAKGGDDDDDDDGPIIIIAPDGP